MPVELLCEIVRRLPQKDRPSFYRAVEQFCDLFPIRRLRPDAVYHSHMRHGYSVADVWELIEEEAFEFGEVSIPFPPDVSLPEVRKWREILLGLCRGALREEETPVDNWLASQLDDAGRHPIDFLPDSANSIEIYDVPSSYDEEDCRYGLSVFGICCYALFTGDSKVDRLTVAYVDARYEAWQFLKQIFLLPLCPYESMELRVEEEEGGRSVFQFFTICDDSIETYDKLYLLNLTMNSTRGFRVRSISFSAEKLFSKNYVVTVRVWKRQ